MLPPRKQQHINKCFYPEETGVGVRLLPFPLDKNTYFFLPFFLTAVAVARVGLV